MRVILRSASPRHLALFSLVFTYSVSLNLIAIRSGPYLSQLFSVASRFLLIIMLLGFILLVLPLTPKATPWHRLGLHGPYFSNRWFFRVYVSGHGVFLELL